MSTMKGQRVLTESNVRVVKAFMTGKYLKASVSDKMRAELKKTIGASDPQGVLRKLEEMGLIAGYVPVLTEEGARVLTVMELMYGIAKNGSRRDDALEEMME